MCGLVGIAGDTTGTWKDLFTNLLVVDSLRGTHSTGAAIIQRFQSEVELIKEVGHPFNLLSTKLYGTALNKSAKALIGHNRYATLGKHTVENAHPFEFPNVVGAHNGTLEKAAIAKLHDHDKFGTDSEAIYAHMNLYGVEDTISKLSGAWALTWFDREKNTINLLRNSKRPLFYAYSKDECTLMWASEPDMLRLVIGRCSRSFYQDNIFSVPTDEHMSWEIPDSICNKFPAPVQVKREGATYSSVFDYSNYHFPRSPTSYTNYRYDDKKNNKKVKVDTAKFRPPYKDHTGKVLNKEAHKELVGQGCVFCGMADQQWGEFIHPLKSVDGKRIYLCEDCYEDDEVFEICENLI